MDEECQKGEEVTWRPFKENMHLRCVKTWTTIMAKDGIGHTRPDSPLSWNMPVRFGKKVSRMIQQRSPLANAKPMKMYLMALLAEEEEEDDDDDDCYKEERNDGGESETIHDFCKFMVKHQDAVVIPYGHTFPHLYQRELWASHENFSNCSSFIMEIMDVF